MHKIQTKLTFGMVLIIIITVASLWVYQVAFLEQNVMKSQENTLKQHVMRAGEMFREDALDVFEAYAEDLYYTDNVTLEINSTDGRWLYTTGTSMGRGHMMGQRSIRGDYLSTILDKGEVTMISTNTRLGTDILVYGYAIPEQNVVLSGSIPLEPINETISILQKQLVYLTAILIVLAMLISAFIAKVFIKPIAILDRSVRRISEGELDTRVDIRTKDEFGALANNFNHMAQNLSKVDKLRKDLVANVSHELRTPLGIIKGYAELTRDLHGSHPEKRTANMDLIIEEVDRLSGVVDDILDFSQIQSGYMNLKKTFMSPNAQLKGAYEKYRVLAEEKQIDLSLKLCEDDLMVEADVQRINQVLHNFLANAIGHTPPGGKVTIQSELTSDHKLRISVADTGSGIPEDSLDQIWERYYKVKVDGERRGSGLGLSIVKHILDAHGFRYGVRSVLGEGSVFFFEMEVRGEKTQDSDHIIR